MKKKKGTALLMAGIILFCCGCSSQPSSAEGDSGSSAEMGRYVEEQIELPDQETACEGLVRDETVIRLVNTYGEDIVSSDGGKSFEAANDAPESYMDMLNKIILNTAETPQGDRIFTEYEDDDKQNHYLVTKDGQVIGISGLDGSSSQFPFYGTDGDFYVIQENKVYRVDPENGETAFLYESQGYPFYAVSDGKRLYMAEEAGIQIYDLEKRESAEKDTVLNDFLTGKLAYSAGNSHEFLLYPYEEGVYVLTQDGLYHHTLYEDGMEQIIDGSLCSIGDISRGYVGMAAIEEEDSLSFLIYYSDGSLMRYTYDASLSAVPETVLRIYGVYEDGSVRQAVSAFRQQHPEIYVSYEVGIDSDYGITLDDALKNLSTELAAGDGPDILIMDDIPYDSYLERGALMELGSIREEMDQEEYFVNVIDGFQTDKGLYTIPLTFAVPVLGGESDKLAGAGSLTSLSELADLMEAARNEKPEGSVFSFKNAEEELQLLSQSSQGAWLKEDGTLNKEAVTEFLTQAKRIYDAQMEGLTEKEITTIYSVPEWGTGENVLINRFDSNGAQGALSEAVFVFEGQPFFAGFLSSAVDDFPMFIGELKYAEGDYVMMPGQQYGTCLASTLISVNNASERKEEALLFLDYVLSGQFQSTAYLNGTPINKEAYYKKQISPRDPGQLYTMTGGNRSDGSFEMIEIYWPAASDFSKLNSLLESVTGVNRCDYRVYEAVIETGETAVMGEIGIEEAVNTIEKKVQLYLAE